MDHVKTIENNQPHEISELICLKCYNRAIHVYPEKTLLKKLECKCGEIGYLIKTGQTLPKDNECKSCTHFKGKCILNLHSNEQYYCEYYIRGD